MTIANFETFRDSSISLSNTPNNRSRTLTQDIRTTPQNGEGAILMWKHWRQGSGAVSYQVSVNGTPISTPTISSDVAVREFVTLQEVISTSIIEQGDNRVTFEVADGTGTLRVSDVVLMFNQSEVIDTNGTTAATFEQFRDSSFGLRIGADIDRTLTSNLGSTPVQGEGAVLMWKHWRQGSGPVSYQVAVNGNPVSTPTISETTPTRTFVSVHEVIRTGDIRQGDNDIRFMVTDGTGTLRIADVVLLYRREVDGPGETVAGYELFSDQSTSLRIGADIDETLRSDLSSIPVQGEGAFLTWKHWRQGTGPVSYRVSVNGTQVSAPTIGGQVPVRDFTTQHEMIRTGDLVRGDNDITFEVTDGSGTVRISDVVLYYRNRNALIET